MRVLIGLVLLATLSGITGATGLPQVAPPGAGAIKPSAGAGTVENKYQRRLDSPAKIPSPPSVSPTPGSSTLFQTPSGATTDTGKSLGGPQGGAMRDAKGGVWNCTGAGCFSPDGEFKPMYKSSPAVAPPGNR